MLHTAHRKGEERFVENMYVPPANKLHLLQTFNYDRKDDISRQITSDRYEKDLYNMYLPRRIQVTCATFRTLSIN
jgi:hypothetical protein